MDPNYRPQESIPPPIGPRGFFTGVRIRPIIVGVIVDHVATYVLTILYLIAYFLKEPLGETLSEEAIQKALNEALSSPEGLVSLGIIGAFCTALGGYAAGRLAKVDEVKHGALVGLASLIFGVVQKTMAGAGVPVPYWYDLLAYIIAIPAGALGGFFAQGSGGRGIGRFK